jgi:hypothetical protein
MKNLFLIVLFFTFLTIVVSYSNGKDKPIQNDLIGYWQYYDSTITDGLMNYFRFENNHHFIYRVNSYDRLSIIRGVEGEYNISKDSIYLKIIYINNWENGVLEFGNTLDDGANNLQYKHGKENKTKKLNPSYQALPFNIKYTETKKILSIEIGGFEYFKINYPSDDE